MPLTGWIPPAQRNQAQHDAHKRAMAHMRNFTLPFVRPPVGTKIILTDFWKAPAVVSKLGFAFTGFRQLTGSCFPAGTPIRMADGSEKPVEDVCAGDMVVTHMGRSRRVKQTMRRQYNGELYSFAVQGFPFPIEMTADHEVALDCGGEIEWRRADEVAEHDRVILGWNKTARKGEVLDAADLLGGEVVVLDELMKDDAFTKNNEPDVPHANVASARGTVRKSGINWRGKVRLRRSRVENSINRFIPVCPSLGRLIGLYLAEGGCHEGRVVFTLNAKEKTLAAEIISLVVGLFGVDGEIVHQTQRPNTLKVRFTNLNLATFFKSLIPGNVYSKRVPPCLFRAEESTRIATILGWMDGDGHVTIKKDGNVRITGVTVCADLARDMTTMAASCGMRATAGIRKQRKQSKQSYNVDFSGKKAISLFPKVAHRAVDATDLAVTTKTNGLARPITSIRSRPVEMMTVYDFEVEEDHSLVAGGLTLHNCVGVSTGNWLTTLSCIQATLSTNPTVPFVAFWPFDYGRTRFNEGDSGQGEGAIDSVAGQTIATEGYIDITQPGLPTFDTADGFAISSNLEMQYSDGASSVVTKWLPLAKQHLGAKAPLYTTDDVCASIINGYPVIDGDNNYIGNGSIQGSGADACAVGRYDGVGGHSTCKLGYWNHPTLGDLILYSNQWDGNTYPTDPAGGGRCTVWMPRSEMDKHFSSGGGDQGETMALSHVDWFPAQPAVIDWFI